MPVNITTTQREVKNKTGVDVSVASYDPAPSPKQVKNYHVVVISKLPFFKLPEHSDEDTVQFMVRRDYAAFEQLQKDILLSFPDLKLPTFPRKYHVFMTEADIEERMVSFDCIVKIIARHKRMSVSAPMLEFLGFDLVSDKNYFKARREYLQKQQDAAEKLKKDQQQMFGDKLAAVDQGLFGESEPFSDDSGTKSPEPFTGDSIFEENEAGSRVSAKISVLKEEEALMLPGTQKTDSSQQPNQNSIVDQLEDNSELLNVTGSLDDVLKIAEKTKKSAPKKVTPGGSGLGLFDEEEEEAGPGVGDMGTDDIMKYIQQNQTANDEEDLDLF